MSQLNNISIDELDSNDLKILWALDKMSGTNKDRFTATEVSNFLIEKSGENISRQAVWATLTKKPKLCNKNKAGFKIMKAGLNHLLSSQKATKLIFIESGKPFLAKNIELNKVLGKASGTIKICDPYVDLNTLDVIYKNVNKNDPTQILTSKVIDKPSGIFLRQIQELRAEGFNIEVRIYNQSTLHDRYFMDDSTFWLSGNSLNHLGAKESFIIQLGEDVRQSMSATFNNRWRVASVI